MSGKNLEEITMKETNKILVTGAVGQIGSELVPELRKLYSNENVVAGWRNKEPRATIREGPVERVDVNNKDALKEVIEKYNIDTVYHLASLLSAVGEKKPDLAWHVNINGLKNVLDLAKEHDLKIYWPSSIAVFGPTTPKVSTPQKTVLEPETMYGVTKVAGENLVNYYSKKLNVDIRSLRYPGLISWKTPPGGGTTDYAVEIFYDAIKKESYTSFLREDSNLPMMYMDDAIRATIEIMDAPAEKIKIRTSYNLAAISFTPGQLAAEIKKNIPNFSIDYKPDFRQKIADSCPDSIDDFEARKDWGWNSKYGLAEMTKDMLDNLRKTLK